MKTPHSLAAAAALVSSLSGVPLPSDAVYYGELGLSGAIRPVAHAAARAKEAAKLGFERAVAPPPRDGAERSPLRLNPMAHITDLVAGIAGSKPRQRPVLARGEG